MTQQSTADEITDVAADATNTATDLGKETAERVAKKVTETSAKAIGIAADTQKSVGENIEKVSKRLQGVSSFNQQNMEALTKASEIAAKAFEGIGKEVAAYSKKSYEERLAAVQDIASAKTISELIEKQTSFAQNSFGGWMNQASKLNEIYTAAIKDIAAPIGQRFSAAAEEMKV